MSCDFIIAADTAKFGQPEIKLGIMPGAGGTQRLTRFVGKSKAMEMCLTGRMMDAAEAERSGLVSRVVPAAELLDDCAQDGRRHRRLSLPAVMMTKESVNRAYETTLSGGIHFERRVFHAMFATEDQRRAWRPSPRSARRTSSTARVERLGRSRRAKASPGTRPGEPHVRHERQQAKRRDRAATREEDVVGGPVALGRGELAGAQQETEPSECGKPVRNGEQRSVAKPRGSLSALARSHGVHVGEERTGDERHAAAVLPAVPPGKAREHVDGEHGRRAPAIDERREARVAAHRFGLQLRSCAQRQRRAPQQRMLRSAAEMMTVPKEPAAASDSRRLPARQPPIPGSTAASSNPTSAGTTAQRGARQARSTSVALTSFCSGWRAAR